MAITNASRRFWRKARIWICLLPGGVVLTYLVLVLAGGGWSPRNNERFAWEDGSVLLFAHRGVAETVPENCLAAFDAACRAGFPGVEIDIRKTKDGRLALFHDSSAERMLGLKGKFGDLTLAEIQARGLIFQGRETTNRVPTLQDVFLKFGQKLLFYIDMKNKGFRDADLLAQLIQECRVEERTVVASTDPLFVAYLEQRYPALNTALERFDAAQVCLYRFTPKRWKPDFLSGSTHKVSASHVEWLRGNQLLSHRIVYDVNKANYPAALRLGVAKAIVEYAPGIYSEHLRPREW